MYKVDQWLGRKVLEKSFYEVQRFAAEEGGIELCLTVPCIGHQKLSLGSEERASRGKEHSPPSVVKPTIETDCTANFERRDIFQIFQ